MLKKLTVRTKKLGIARLRCPGNMLRKSSALIAFLTLAGLPGRAQSIHSFQGGSDGANPGGGLVAGPNGVFYGTTQGGGSSPGCTDPAGCGTVYQLIPPSTPGGPWSESVIYALPNYGDPIAMPTVGLNGELYVTAFIGGDLGVGDVTELKPPSTPGSLWTGTEIYRFNYPSGNPQNPLSSVVVGPGGTLYGTVPYAGTASNCGTYLGTNYGCGGVYTLTPPTTPGGLWTESLIYAFEGSPADGGFPNTALVPGMKGVFYGTTNAGGSGSLCVEDNVPGPNIFTFGSPSSCGTVFELDPPSSPGGDWTETVLYSFQGGADGGYPNGVTYHDGKLYGTTVFGGDPKNCGGVGCGGVFELSPPQDPGDPWTEKVIYSFSSGSDGLFPVAGVTFGFDGAIYGTTRDGGGSSACPSNPGCGIVFRLQPPSFPGLPWQESVLHRFALTDGGQPTDALAVGADGALYGTTLYGGVSATCQSCGTVFRIDPKLWRQPWSLANPAKAGLDPAATALTAEATGRAK